MLTSVDPCLSRVHRETPALSGLVWCRNKLLYPLSLCFFLCSRVKWWSTQGGQVCTDPVNNINPRLIVAAWLYEHIWKATFNQTWDKSCISGLARLVFEADYTYMKKMCIYILQFSTFVPLFSPLSIIFFFIVFVFFLFPFYRLYVSIPTLYLGAIPFTFHLSF